MKKSFTKALKGYLEFRDKYVHGDASIMQSLSRDGQKPEIMVVACCDSRVDPALILQCDPGDLFVVRNVANIIPPFEKDEAHHGTSAALEFATCYLKVKHIIILGHSQCGGIQALLSDKALDQDDFITNWVEVIKTDTICDHKNTDEYAKRALTQSYQNCLTFPWIRSKLETKEIMIHRWFFDIKEGQIFTYNEQEEVYAPLSN